MENAVEMFNIVKQYPLVRAVDNVNFTLLKGEIHSLLGENGAGKSTLMKVLYGMNYPYEGEVYVNGEKVSISSPGVAISKGISMVHQHFMLTDVMTVYENIVIGREPRKGIFFDSKKALEEVEKMIKEYNFDIDAKEKIENLSVGEQQRVEILKAMYTGADIIILDEPTAVLTPQEVNELFRIINQLKSEGKTIVIITHKLKETLEIADRVTVLRDGKVVSSAINTKDINEEQLAELMVGRKVKLGLERPSECIGDVLFEVKNLNYSDRNIEILKNINIQIRKGEILGIAGIEGNGQSELLEIITGVMKPTTMTLIKDNKELNLTARSAIDNRIGHIPEDRNVQGLINEMSIKENVILGYHYREDFSHNGILKQKNIENYADEQIKNYDIKANNFDVKCGSLSGGNQQKVVISRVFSQNPDVIVIAQPTRGVDVGAMEYIHSKMLDLRDSGKAILLISADLDEVRSLSDRLLVIYEGTIVSESLRGELTELEIGLFMSGSKNKGD